MTRPIYESPHDRAKERAVLRTLAERWQSEVIPAPKLSCYDAVIKRDGAIVGLVEIKCRNVRSDTYPNIILSKPKVDKICRIARAGQITVKPLFVVRFLDKIMGVELQPELYQMGKAGRIDRGDAADVEICYEIPIEWFNLISRVES